MPVVLAAHWVKGPVGILGIDENDACFRIERGVIIPHVVIAVGAVRILPRLLEPGVRVGGVVNNNVGDDADTTLVSVVDEFHKIINGAELRQNLAEITDVIAAVTQRGIVERWQPDEVDTQPLKVIKFFRYPLERTGTGALGVIESAGQHFVKDRILVPLMIGPLPRIISGSGGRNGKFFRITLDDVALSIC